LAAPRARRSRRLGALHLAVGLALGGEAGARLAGEVGVPISPDTLLRGIQAASLPAAPTPRVLGVDDWCWRRGRRYDSPNSLAKSDAEFAVRAPRCQLRERYGAATKRADRRRRQGAGVDGSPGGADDVATDQEAPRPADRPGEL